MSQIIRDGKVYDSNGFPSFIGRTSIGSTTHNMAVGGTQEIIGTGFPPEMIKIDCFKLGSKERSWGVGYKNPAKTICAIQNLSQQMDVNNQYIIYLYTDAANYIVATLTNFTSNGFKLFWEYTGFPLGTAQIIWEAYR